MATNWKSSAVVGMSEASLRPQSRPSFLPIVFAVLCCALAALSATYLSGLNFPEANNIWHIPVVLDLGRSVEGPHDLYHRSFSKFVSAFWLLVRIVTTEDNIGIVFPVIQLLGNMLLSSMLFALVFQATRSAAKAAIVVSGLCFCYGLWGVTRLGFSELFTTYATHTQISIIFCLLSLCLLLGDRAVWSGVMLSIAADANLFMAGWTGLAAGIYLLATERRFATRAQVRLLVAFSVLSVPIVIWALRSGSSSSTLPPGFFRTHIPGHVYALTTPQGGIHMLSLGLAAGLGAAMQPAAERVRRLGVLTLACVATLLLGAAMPYLTENALLMQLNPLRFSSIVTLMAAACAAAMLVASLDRNEADGALFLFVAVLGFGLKAPVMTIIGLSLAMPAGRRWIGLTLAGVAGMADLIPNGIADNSPKTQLAFLLICAVLTTAILRRRVTPKLLDDAPWLSLVAAWGTVGVMPGAGPWPTVAALVGLAATALTGPTLRWVVLAASTVAIILSMALEPSGVRAVLPVGAGLALLVAASVLCRLPQLSVMRVRWGAVGGVAAVAILVVAGVTKGALAGFGVQQSEETKAFLAAEIWARASTPPDSMFDFWRPDRDGFSLFSRRPVWWEGGQMPGMLWEPSIYSVWICRRDAISAAVSESAREDVAVNGNVAYLVYRVGSRPPAFQHFVPVYANTLFGIARRVPPLVASPLCPEP